MTDSNSQAVEAAEREKFEDACEKLGPRPVRDATGEREYVSEWDDTAWSGWKMRATLSSPVAEVAQGVVTDAEVDEAIRQMNDPYVRSRHDMRRVLENFAASRAPVAVGVGLSIQQEPKYTVNGSAIVNRASGEPIPADEPVFIFRARDKHACSIIGEYAQFCDNPEHREAVNQRFIEFGEFADRHPDRMREPDTIATSAKGATK